ncbi:MAG TPA: hypothetical protein VKU91_04760, partial [Acidimicrobiales bacterium]|nr:hypothetical protein [Acidimicrobiales bacterium]
MDDTQRAIERAASEGKLLVDPYEGWTARQGIPVVEGFAVDLLSVDTAPWHVSGTPAALVHVAGRGDFANVIVLELPPAGATSPQRHLYEEVVYVLTGH